MSRCIIYNMNIHLFQILYWFFSLQILLSSFYCTAYGYCTENISTINGSATGTHNKLRRNLLGLPATITFKANDTHTCAIATLTWDITTPSSIQSSKFVTIKFNGNPFWATTSIDSIIVTPPFFSTFNKEFLVVTPNEPCTGCSIIISNVILPSLAQPLNVSLNIASEYTAEVSIPLLPREINDIEVKAQTTLIVTEVGRFKVVLLKHCNFIISAVQCTVFLPDAFKSEDGKSEVTNLSTNINSDSPIIEFTLRNPPSRRFPGDFSDSRFKIVVSAAEGELLIAHATFADDVISGQIKTTSLTSSNYNAGDQSTYTFTIGIAHPIPNNGRMKIEFSPNVTILSASSSSVNLPFTHSILISNGVIIVFEKGITNSTPVIVTVLNVMNPLVRQTHTGFKATTYENDSDIRVIDEPGNMNLTITNYGAGKLSCTMDNQVNLAPVVYKCSFESTYINMPSPDNEENTLTFSIPDQPIDCTIGKLLPEGIIYETAKGKYTIKGTPTTKTIEIPIACNNPAITKPTDGFVATLYHSSGEIMIQQSARIQTSIGAKLKSCTLVSEKSCPKCESYCDVKLTRASKTPIKYIFIKNSLISSADGCQLNGSPTTCDYSAGEVSVNALSITADIVVVRLPLVTNPDKVGSVEGRFSIITYADDGKVQKVDEDIWEAGTSSSGSCLLSVSCNHPCNTCKTNQPEKCTSCTSDLLLDENTCVESCPPGTIVTGNLCEKCDSNCKECAGIITYCTKCPAAQFMFENKCYITCPIQTTESTTEKICIKCGSGCDVCDKSNPEICIKCSIGYKYLNFICYRTCPKDYIASDDELECVKIVIENSTSTSTSSGQFFPHLITAVLLGIVTAAGQSREGRAMMISNLVVVINYVAISSYVVQIIFGLNEAESLVVLVTLAIVAMQIILNFLFCIPYNKYIKHDAGFEGWAKTNSCTKFILVTLSTIFTLQNERFFYSRFLGFDLFFAKFVNFGNLLKPLNYFSIAQIILVQFPVVIIDILQLTKLTWGTTLYTTLIESLVLSLLLLMLIAYEIKNVQSTLSYISQSTDQYSKLSDNSMMNQFTGYSPKPFDEERLRKEIFDEVFQKISITLKPARTERFERSQNKPERRQSYSKGTDYAKEKDIRKSKSYPCSPRTARSKEIPYKKSRLDEDRAISPERLLDNVLSDSFPGGKGRMMLPANDLGMQTIPFEKLEMFKRQMGLKGSKKRKMFEHTPNPLAAIPEKYDDEDEERKRKVEEAKKLNNQLMSEGIVIRNS